MDNQGKDVRLSFKSVKHGQDNNGNQRSQLSLSQEEALKLYEAMGALLENPRGVKLDVHFTTPTTKDGSRTFDSGYAFVTGIKEFGSYANTNAAAPTRFRPVAKTGATPTNTVKARIAQAKKDIAG